MTPTTWITQRPLRFPGEGSPHSHLERWGWVSRPLSELVGDEFFVRRAATPAPFLVEAPVSEAATTSNRTMTLTMTLPLMSLALPPIPPPPPVRMPPPTPLMPSHRRELQHAQPPPSPPPPSPSPPPPSPPPSPPFPPVAMGATFVGTVAGLTSALANTAVGHMVLAPGTYFLSGELSVTRSVIIEAAVAGSVVLHAQASGRVLNVNPGSSGVVRLIGLNITGGRDTSVRASCSKVPIAPMGDSCFAHCLQGGGVYVSSGTVTITSSSITGNTANYDVRAHVQKFPSPRCETHVWLVVCRLVVFVSMEAQCQS